MSIVVDSKGAELQSLRHARYGEMLWQAEPIWPQHAPVLFPIVGQLPGDVLLHDGKRYSMRRHGFARDREFTWKERRGDSCVLALADDAETRERYPFAFRFEMHYSVAAETLSIEFVLHNPGTEVLPASVGAHPAFRWPLAEGAPKEAHTLEFSRPEPAPVRRLQDGLLQAEAFDTPIEGRRLRLRESLFEADALILMQVASRSVRYRAYGAPTIDVSWNEFRQLGIWSKAGASFLCIEPWYGYASPVGFADDFTIKPGLLHVPPGESRRLAMGIRIYGS